MLDIKEAKTFKDRFFGLMFKKNINYGLLFNNCKAIHTFFMKDKIDIVALDKDNNILKIYKCVSPWKIIIAPKHTKKIYELPKNTVK